MGEDAVIEKDGLIRKLTEAVDAQLDKVEYLESKLERAEEEFCKMEDEMKDMEDAIEALRSGSTDGTREGDHKCDIASEQKLVEMVERERCIEEREKILSEKEDEIREREISVQKEKEELRIKGDKISNEEELSDDVRTESVS